MWKLKKMTQMDLLRKQKQTQRLRKQTYGYETGRIGVGGREIRSSDSAYMCVCVYVYYIQKR